MESFTPKDTVTKKAVEPEKPERSRGFLLCFIPKNGHSVQPGFVNLQIDPRPGILARTP